MTYFLDIDILSQRQGRQFTQCLKKEVLNSDITLSLTSYVCDFTYFPCFL